MRNATKKSVIHYKIDWLDFKSVRVCSSLLNTPGNSMGVNINYLVIQVQNETLFTTSDVTNFNQSTHWYAAVCGHGFLISEHCWATSIQATLLPYIYDLLYNSILCVDEVVPADIFSKYSICPWLRSEYITAQNVLSRLCLFTAKNKVANFVFT